MKNPLSGLMSALYRATPVDRAVDALDILYTKLMLGTRSEKHIGEGARRARERLAAERKARPDVPMDGMQTRQRARRERILRNRQIMTIAKREAASMRDLAGGSMRINTPDDIDAVLG